VRVPLKAAESSGAQDSAAAYLYAGRVTGVMNASVNLCGNAAFPAMGRPRNGFAGTTVALMAECCNLQVATGT
jgi:hypothetical protein